METDVLNELEQLSVEELEERLSGHLNSADAYMIEARAIASKSAVEVFLGGRVAFVLRELLKKEKEWEKWLRDHPHFKRSTVNRAVRLYESVIAIEGDEAEQALGKFTPTKAYKHYLREFKESSKEAMSQNGTSEAESSSSDDQPSESQDDQPVDGNAQSDDGQVSGDQNGGDADTDQPRDPATQRNDTEAGQDRGESDSSETNALPRSPLLGVGGFGPNVPDSLPEQIQHARQAMQNPEMETEARHIAQTISKALLLEAVSMIGWEHTFELLTALKDEASVPVKPKAWNIPENWGEEI